jgi:hypothetical protein
MRIGQKLRQAITSSFIEVRLEEDREQPQAPEPDLVMPPPEVASFSLPEPLLESQVSVVPEPEPEADPLTPPDFDAVLRGDGTLNDNIVYAGATLAAVPFSAEQAVEVLVGMPYGVTPRGRCQAMEQAISVVTDDPCAAGHLVVSDAAQKMVALNQYLARSRDSHKTFRRNVAAEMERLHERLNQLRVLADEANASYQSLEEAGRVRVDDLTGVIAFFDEFQAYLRLEEVVTNSLSEDELPAYMREDTAMKLLGVQSDGKKAA